MRTAQIYKRHLQNLYVIQQLSCKTVLLKLDADNHDNALQHFFNLLFTMHLSNM